MPCPCVRKAHAASQQLRECANQEAFARGEMADSLGKAFTGNLAPVAALHQ